MKIVLRHVVAVGALALLTQACSSTSSEACDPSSCSTGCCDSTGRCVGGADPAACGTGGAACAACSSTQTCSAGACVALSTGGDGGSDSGVTSLEACRASCPGCCEPDGTCRVGTTNDACGLGELCVDCTGAQTCVSGECRSPTCTTCVAANGSCHNTGNSNTNCGRNGESCRPCSDGALCSGGVCVGAQCSDGCLDSNGECRSGTTFVHCGVNGNTCRTCATGQSCSNGTCVGGSGSDAGSCADNPCIAHSGPLPSSCGGCQTAICQSDPFCCSNVWDSNCAAKAQAECFECTSQDAGEDAGTDPDAGSDGGAPDGGTDAGSGGTDAGFDGGPAGLDAGLYTSSDGGLCGNPCTGHQFAQNAACGTCQSTVCGLDPYCCGQDPGTPGGGLWDFICAETAEDNCTTECSGSAVFCALIGDPCTANNQCCTAYCNGSTCQQNPNLGAASCGPVVDLCAEQDAGVSPKPPSCDPCVEVVCYGDPYCCDMDPTVAGGTWDDICAGNAALICERCGP